MSLAVTGAYHIPVLQREVLEYLQPKPEGVYVDGTIGGGGHALLIAEQLSPGGMVIGFDRDMVALETAGRQLQSCRAKVTLIHDSFSTLRTHLKKLGIESVDGVLLDLGVSSRQLDDGSRGFSFQSDARLDMRMDQTQTLDAFAVVNTYDASSLAHLLREYGEEPQAGRIARRVVETRERDPIATTRALSEIVRSVCGGRNLPGSLARVYQAIRIEVNGELRHLRTGLADAVVSLRPGGRIVALSYHSLEDRIVKTTFAEEARTVIRSGQKLVPDTPVAPRLAILTKKPVMASDEEVALNGRARSAKLRAAEKVAA